MNRRMPALKAAFEAAGFEDVRTLRSSGNVLFSAPAASEARLQRQAEAAMMEALGQAFLTIVRPVDALREILASDPYKAFRLPPAAKRIVTFLRDQPKAKLALPIERDGARILLTRGAEISAAPTSQVPKDPSSCPSSKRRSARSRRRAPGTPSRKSRGNATRRTLPQ